MVLISHRYKFIFIKPKKVAGTSVEALFERYCQDPNLPYKCEEKRSEEDTEFGVIGHRGQDGILNNYIQNTKWLSHMSLTKLKGHVEKNVFDNYLKFTVIRNPWDCMVSWYSFCITTEAVDASFEDFISFMLFGVALFFGMKYNYDDFCTANIFMIDKKIEDFSLTLSDGRTVNTAGKLLPTPVYNWLSYTLNGVPSCDFYIRYENLKEDILEVAKRLNILDLNIENLPEYKSGYRDKSKSYREFYNDKTRQLVYEMYKEEIDYFKYEF